MKILLALILGLTFNFASVNASELTSEAATSIHIQHVVDWGFDANDPASFAIVSKWLLDFRNQLIQDETFQDLVERYGDQDLELLNEPSLYIEKLFEGFAAGGPRAADEHPLAVDLCSSLGLVHRPLQGRMGTSAPVFSNCTNSDDKGLGIIIMMMKNRSGEKFLRLSMYDLINLPSGIELEEESSDNKWCSTWFNLEIPLVSEQNIITSKLRVACGVGNKAILDTHLFEHSI